MAAANIILVGITWWYASQTHRLVSHTIEREQAMKRQEMRSVEAACHRLVASIEELPRGVDVNIDQVLKTTHLDKQDMRDLQTLLPSITTVTAEQISDVVRNVRWIVERLEDFRGPSEKGRFAWERYHLGEWSSRLAKTVDQLRLVAAEASRHGASSDS